jgi:predicted transcriptional regulator
MRACYKEDINSLTVKEANSNDETRTEILRHISEIREEEQKFFNELMKKIGDKNEKKDTIR